MQQVQFLTREWSSGKSRCCDHDDLLLDEFPHQRPDSWIGRIRIERRIGRDAEVLPAGAEGVLNKIDPEVRRLGTAHRSEMACDRDSPRMRFGDDAAERVDTDGVVDLE